MIGKGEVLRKYDHSMKGFIEVVRSGGGNNFMRPSWVQAKPLYKRCRGLFEAKKDSVWVDQDFIA